MAPATTPHALVGVNGIVTAETLTRNTNPPHVAGGEIKPKSPLFTPVFASKLLFNAGKANCDALPAIPTLTIVADDNADKYVRTPQVKAWAGAQRAVHNPLMTNVQCVGSYHELDNELEPIAGQVRAMAAQFVGQALKFHAGDRVDVLDELPAGPCRTF